MLFACYGAGDLVKQQQTASASPQDGYADLLAGLGSNNSQGIADGPASTSNTSEQSQRQAGSHSRRVSWDDSILDGPNAPALAHKSGKASWCQL